MTPPARKKILVVEDDPLTRTMISQVLEHEGMSVLTAKDGIEGVEAAGRELPDLIVLDISMPRLSGYDAAKRLRADPRTRRTPILMCTASDTRPERSLAAGADDYIEKPFDTGAFRAKVRKLLGLP